MAGNTMKMTKEAPRKWKKMKKWKTSVSIIFLKNKTIEKNLPQYFKKKNKKRNEASKKKDSNK